MAEELLCGGASYYWWNNSTPSAVSDPMLRKTTSDVDNSTLQMLGFGFPSSDWSQPNHLLHGGSMLEEEEEEETTCSISYSKHKDWNSPPNKSFSSEEDDSSPSSFNIINTSGYGFVPLNSNYNNNSNYSLLEPQQQLFNNGYNSSWQKVSPFLQHESPTVASNFNTPFWNTSDRSFLPPQSQVVRPNLLPTKTKAEQVREPTSVARKCISSTDEPAFKRPRMETPSPLPTFKVRKEKLGDRITALQQLVSPFGKTDTASVLHEAIEYIKFLHDQLTVLTTPYMKNGAPIQHQHQHQHQHQQMQGRVRKERKIGGGEDLKSRGLCVVPISSTFPLGSESSPDFLTPTFGATFR